MRAKCFHRASIALALILWGNVAVLSAQEDGPLANVELYNQQMVDEIILRVEEIADRQEAAGCSCCADDCCCTDCCPAWTAGFEATFMRPVLTGNLNFDHEIAPRIWLGFTSSTCLGARVRYWQFDHTSETISESFGPASLSAFRSLELHELDVEATYRWEGSYWTFLAAGGLRYFDSRRTTISDGTDGMDDFRTMEEINSHGIGPTLALEAYAPISSFGGLALYLNGRVSLVGGDTNQSGVSTENNVPIVTVNVDSENLTVMSELQTGVEYSRDFGSTSLFLRAGMEGHIWSTSAPIDFDGRDDDKRFGLVGFAFAAGLTR